MRAACAGAQGCDLAAQGSARGRCVLLLTWQRVCVRVRASEGRAHAPAAVLGVRRAARVRACATAHSPAAAKSCARAGRAGAPLPLRARVAGAQLREGREASVGDELSKKIVLVRSRARAL
jgi:hypothetical protein